MTTINLRDGLEVLYYFGEQDFNPQRNQLQDHSGYGRHATAQGGPTVGVNGPNNFEAASFDGSDDNFDVSDPVASDAQSIFVLCKIDVLGEENFIVEADGGSDGYYIFTTIGDSIRWRIYNGNGNADDGGGVTVSKDWNADEWLGIVGTYDGNSSALYLNGELKGRTSIPDHNQATTNLNIGAGEFDGDIAVAGKWSRPLSDAEIQELNDLTAPRRSQL